MLIGQYILYLLLLLSLLLASFLKGLFLTGLSVDGDSQGVERLFGALSAHMWPGMILKTGDKITEPSLPETEGYIPLSFPHLVFTLNFKWSSKCFNNLC